MIRISIVEDHRETRNTLVQLLQHAPGVVHIGAYSNAKEAEIEIPHHVPDVVLMDINLPGRSGIECVATLKASHPQIEFVMLTTYDETELIFNALRAGASGYLLKSAKSKELLAAITQVHQGGSPMSMAIARRIVTHFHQMPKRGDSEIKTLTKREREILDLLSDGLLDKQIADRLAISPLTVPVHLRRIYIKLHVHTRTEAVVKYLRG